MCIIDVAFYLSKFCTSKLNLFMSYMTFELIHFYVAIY